MACAAALVLGFAPLVANAQPGGQLPERGRAQIEALAAAKRARTPAENKVDSPLLTAVQVSKGQRLPAGVRVSSTVKLDPGGRTTVEIHGNVSSALARKVESLGGKVRSISSRNGVVRADVPLSAVGSLSAMPQVQKIQSLASSAITSRMKPSASLSKQQRQAAIRSQLDEALASSSTTTNRSGNLTAESGTVVSEGDKAHGADVARAKRKISGVGITVGVLSDGVDSLQTSITSKNLPADVRVLPGQEGFGDEGTAMLEIVHDLAPKADLVFATAFDGSESFADNIRALRAAGADIIVDDVIYLDESPFQDGPIAQAVLDVTKAGTLYFSSAGNAGNVDDGTAGNYEADFRSSGQKVGKFAGIAHDFDPGSGKQLLDPLSESSFFAPVSLFWANPLGKATDDYDVYGLDPEGNVVGFSNTIQNGNDDPFEIFLNPGAEGTVRLVVVKYSGADRYFQLSALGGRFVADGALKRYATPGVTRGHSAVPAAFSVAAVPAAKSFRALEPGDPVGPRGPYPSQFTKAQQSERFTSDGLRRIFFTPSGQALTPGNLSSTGGQVRRKPDLSAADGVSTSVATFEQFYGTSASAPHAAAMAALALSGQPGISPAKARAAMIRSSIDIERTGYDRNTGTGILMAPALLDAVGAKAQPYAVAAAPVVATSTDGDAFLESGEQATVNVPVTNEGDVTSKGVQVRLTSATAGVTIAPASQSYGDIGAQKSKSRAYVVTAPRTVRAGQYITFQAQVTFLGDFSPTVSQPRLLVGQPSSAVVNAAYSGPPVAIPQDEEGVSVPLRLAGVGAVSKVTFSIDGTTCSTNPGSTTVGLDHTYVSDLIGTLTSPSGASVLLFAGVGGEGRNFCKTVLADSATRVIQSAQTEDAPFTGTWRPAQPLSDLIGVNGNGTWKFSVQDVFEEDSGSIRAVSIHASGFLAPPG